VARVCAILDQNDDRFIGAFQADVRSDTHEFNSDCDCMKAASSPDQATAHVASYPENGIQRQAQENGLG